MRIALVTCNIGGLDEVIKPVEQSISCDYYCFTEANLPYPLPNMDNRTKSKYLKLMTHRFLPDYDIYVWIDGCVKVAAKDFVEKMVAPIINKETEYVAVKHSHRTDVYEEVNYIISNIKEGNGYFASRYAHQKMEKELDFYTKEGIPKEYPLYACCVFARKNNGLHLFFEEWFLRSLEFSNFDQAMFSYVSWKMGIDIKSFDWDEMEGKFFNFNKHK